MPGSLSYPMGGIRFLTYERRLWLEKSQSDQERNFSRYFLPPATLKTQRTLRFSFFYRIGTEDSVKQSALRAFRRMITFHKEKNNGCFFESSVPIRKSLCGLRAFAVQKPITSFTRDSLHIGLHMAGYFFTSGPGNPVYVFDP